MFTLLACILCVNSPNVELERTIDVMIQVESGGNWNAVGDNGKSIGGLQISRAYWLDGTRFLGVQWPYNDARDPAKARAVVRAYLLHWQRAGQFPQTPEVFARLHNGGPTGPLKACTKPYWHRIQACLSAASRCR